MIRFIDNLEPDENDIKAAHLDLLEAWYCKFYNTNSIKIQRIYEEIQDRRSLIAEDKLYKKVLKDTPTDKDLRAMSYDDLMLCFNNITMYKNFIAAAEVISTELTRRRADAEILNLALSHKQPIASPHEAFQKDLKILLDHIYDFLVEKNRKYGDSALTPISCFSHVSPLEGINIRLDDKIKRLMTGDASEDEDVELDILGYLLIKRIYKMRNNLVTVKKEGKENE